MNSTIDIKEALKIISTTYNHEINNALTPIIILINALQDQLNDTEYMTAINIIDSSAKRIHEITKGIDQISDTGEIHTVSYTGKNRLIKIK